MSPRRQISLLEALMGFLLVEYLRREFLTQILCLQDTSEIIS
jgi:hypothetical protein